MLFCFGTIFNRMHTFTRKEAPVIVKMTWRKVKSLFSFFFLKRRSEYRIRKLKYSQQGSKMCRLVSFKFLTASSCNASVSRCLVTTQDKRLTAGGRSWFASPLVCSVVHSCLLHTSPGTSSSFRSNTKSIVLARVSVSFSICILLGSKG